MLDVKAAVNAATKASYLHSLKVLPVNRRKQAQVVYYLTFNDNDAGLIRRLAHEYGDQFVVIATHKAAAQAKALQGRGVHVELLDRKRLLLDNVISYLKSAQVILVDDYLPELEVVAKPTVIMLWHANGAIKRFGWGDPATSARPAADRRRFQAVYDKYTVVATGSPRMGELFAESFRLQPGVVRPLGFLRSDTLIQHPASPKPAIPVLYAPTYRDDPAAMRAVLQSAFGVFARLSEPVLVKLHPAVTAAVLPPLPENVSVTTTNIEELLPKVETLVTDYSSTVFDYLLCRVIPRVLFYCPDLATYTETPGLQSDFQEQKIGPVCTEPTDLLKKLGSGAPLIDVGALQAVRASWNQYNDGRVADRLLALVATAIAKNK
ncbi:CDP-glycerol glycerophosphotransferase family protein [Lacticaseibacillus nasuensis]|uniref:CDP-glycerol glycerophosphotransferase family protein n=1 Tax=Lacticaseibacillus nasuensis TaxID=944671 RepID=UPI0022485A18|nr:CDP-glycerol glycerophosphotransferase family protein [Lacticaseibacillus nasuensis]MCX2456206.1 CDP-glycerol glycerophosphotransferase family protein [Lacticaseibacillus nasuensis]